MIYDHIILGSGLSALAAAMAVGHRERLLILAGRPEGQFSYYDATRSVPCSFDGPGGLGNAWHGVIPMNLGGRFEVDDEIGYGAFLSAFYPGCFSPYLGTDWLFVPWAPIRPMKHWNRLIRERGDCLKWLHQSASRVSMEGSLAVVHTPGGTTAKCKRLWIAAGATHTPFLLERSFGSGVAREFISDHALCYVGLVDDAIAPEVDRLKQGVMFQAFYNDQRDTLYTRRPARFSFRQLDFGIEQRAVFGMPTGTAVNKIAKRLSPGLLAEAFFNKFGLFPQASSYSVYAQRVVENAYALSDEGLPLKSCLDNIQAQTQLARNQAPFPGLTPSLRNDLFIPGIHLHNSIRDGALPALGLNLPGSPIHVIDASVISNIGPEHHSFKVMHRAYAAVKASSRAMSD